MAVDLERLGTLGAWWEYTLDRGPFHSFIFYPIYPLWVMWKLEPIPADVRVHLGQSIA